MTSLLSPGRRAGSLAALNLVLLLGLLGAWAYYAGGPAAKSRLARELPLQERERERLDSQVSALQGRLLDLRLGRDSLPRPAALAAQQAIAARLVALRQAARQLQLPAYRSLARSFADLGDELLQVEIRKQRQPKVPNLDSLLQAGLPYPEPGCHFPLPSPATSQAGQLERAVKAAQQQLAFVRADARREQGFSYKPGSSERQASLQSSREMFVSLLLSHEASDSLEQAVKQKLMGINTALGIPKRYYTPTAY